MADAHQVLNRLPDAEARVALMRCCGSARWVARMLRRRPYASDAGLYADAEAAWGALGRDDFLEAFAHHPAIGGAPASNGAGAAARAWSAEEQAGVATAAIETVAALRAANRA